MAVMGLAINSIIIKFYNASVLGIYNEAYAWYLILSQTSVWGIHMAVVKYVPETDKEEQRSIILKTALCLTVCLAGMTTAITCIIISFLEFAWKLALYRAILGLLLFSINKVFLSYLNAVCRMTLYAIIQIVRYSLLMVIVFFFALNGIDGVNLSLTFPITESMVLMILVILFRKQLSMRGVLNGDRAKQLLTFGTRILPSNMVIEMNSKVDVVCLGLFVENTSAIGVYSFAILFTDGLYQTFITLRKIINPQLSRKMIDGELNFFLKKLTQIIKKYVYFLYFVIYFMILLCYYCLCKCFLGDEYLFGISFIAIIGGTIVITGKQIILGDVLAQASFPLEESILNTTTVGINIILNVILINLIGLFGAALATAVSYCAFAVIMTFMCRKKLGIRI